jgi:site-specific DNA-cytosine methylase
MLDRSANWGAPESASGKHYTLCKNEPHGISPNSVIRRLTPTEFERLQTVKDSYTSIASDSQRYKMLGNGWTVDVIAYIFSYINATTLQK